MHLACGPCIVRDRRNLTDRFKNSAFKDGEVIDCVLYARVAP